MIGGILKELGVLSALEVSNSEYAYDFLATDGQREYFGEVKKYKKLLGLGTAREFVYKVIESRNGGVLIVSSGVTQRVKKLFEEHNRMYDNKKVHLITSDSRSSIKSNLSKLLIDKKF